ncbi:MAG: hypothetical protein AB1801_02255 [Chloroflexota bacterium]
MTSISRKGDRPVAPTYSGMARKIPKTPGLQVIDYYLWALQRLYEQGEERFFLLLAGDYRLIMDLDDKRNKPYGQWYSDSNPLRLDKLPQ